MVEARLQIISDLLNKAAYTSIDLCSPGPSPSREEEIICRSCGCN
jgi:hypothetical protein